MKPALGLVVALVFVGLLFASGALQAPPVAGAVHAYETAPPSSWHDGNHISVPWSPTVAGTFAGFSMYFRAAPGTGSETAHLGVTVDCDLGLWSASITMTANEWEPKWRSFGTWSGNPVAVGESCEFGFSSSNPNVQHGDAGLMSPAFVIWVVPAAGDGDGGGGNGDGGGVDCDATPDLPECAEEPSPVPSTPGFDALLVVAAVATAFTVLMFKGRR